MTLWTKGKYCVLHESILSHFNYSLIFYLSEFAAEHTSDWFIRSNLNQMKKTNDNKNKKASHLSLVLSIYLVGLMKIARMGKIIYVPYLN